MITFSEDVCWKLKQIKGYASCTKQLTKLLMQKESSWEN